MSALVPTLCVGTQVCDALRRVQPLTGRDAERPGRAFPRGERVNELQFSFV